MKLQTILCDCGDVLNWMTLTEIKQKMNTAKSDASQLSDEQKKIISQIPTSFRVQSNEVWYKKNSFVLCVNSMTFSFCFQCTCIWWCV